MCTLSNSNYLKHWNFSASFRKTSILTSMAPRCTRYLLIADPSSDGSGAQRDDEWIAVIVSAGRGRSRRGVVRHLESQWRRNTAGGGVKGESLVIAKAGKPLVKVTPSAPQQVVKSSDSASWRDRSPSGTSSIKWVERRLSE